MTEDPNIRVMIVDDIPLMRVMLVKFVKTLGIKVFGELPGFEDVQTVEVVEATNGRVALEKLKRHDIHVIFLDLMMPEMDGLAFLRHKKAYSEIEYIPVIVCTAVGDSTARTQAADLGAKGYITKPFTLRSVEETLHSALA